jgi:hypothetical protein
MAHAIEELRLRSRLGERNDRWCREMISHARVVSEQRARQSRRSNGANLPSLSSHVDVSATSERRMQCRIFHYRKTGAHRSAIRIAVPTETRGDVSTISSGGWRRSSCLTKRSSARGSTPVTARRGARCGSGDRQWDRQARTLSRRRSEHDDDGGPVRVHPEPGRRTTVFDLRVDHGP